jgi:hypothetical protein
MPHELDDTWQLLDDFAGAVQLLHTHGGGDGEVLPALCDLAVKVTGADHASVTTARGSTLTTVCATSEVAIRANELQFEMAEGPGFDALSEPGVSRVDDLTNDERWPDFGKRVTADLGLHSMLAQSLRVADDTLGAITVYAARGAAFDAEHLTVLSIMAAIATTTLRVDREVDRYQTLEAALRTSRRIGIGLGVLVATHKVTVDDAWALMSRESMNRNIKVSVMAENIIATGTFEAPPEN